MSNHKEYVRQLTERGIDPDTADKVASAVVATDEGRDRTPEQQQACQEAIKTLNK